MTPAGPPKLRPWRTLSGRVGLAALAGLSVAAVIFFAVGVTLIRSQSQREQRAELDRQARTLADFLSDRLTGAGRSLDPKRCQLEVNDLTRLAPPGTRVSYLHFNRALVAEACVGTGTGIPDEIRAQVSQDVVFDRQLQRVATQDEEGRTVLASAAVVSLAQVPVGAMVVSRRADDLAAAWRELIPLVLLASLAGLAAALGTVLVLERRVTRPLRLLAAATHRVAEGDRSVTISPTGTNEIDRLAAAFNAMVIQLGERDRLNRDFLMRVTHDLRTPLTAIRGHAAALSDGIVHEDDVPRSLFAIEAESTRLERLVSDILDLGKLESQQLRLELQEIDVAAVVGLSCDLVEPACAARDVRLVREIPERASAYGDSVRVGQVVANLLDNAVRWTPEGGQVTVRMALTSDFVETEVLDTGPGVSESEREAIFEPFRSQVTPDGRYGTGLGLATARQLARALGGDIQVGAAPGGGGSFRLLVPRRLQPSNGSPRGAGTASSATPPQ